MFCLVVWLNEDTRTPSVIGPYQGDLVFDDANLLKKQCFRVEVCPITTPENSQIFSLLS